MGIFESILLGAVQGLTEFLPVSSTGHLILARVLFGMESEGTLAFDAILHLATASAVIVYFWSDITMIVNAALRRLGRLPTNPGDMKLLSALLAGTIPAVILGLVLESAMDHLFRNPLLVAGVLVLGSILFIVAEWRYLQSYHDDEVTVKRGFYIGLFQSLALIPGMSRSGASIAGGMLLGFSRSEAARFAFLLAIPIMLGAGTKKLLELIVSNDTVPWLSVSFGAATAFFVGLLAIHLMITFVKRHTLWPFIWYRIILACFVVFVYYLG